MQKQSFSRFVSSFVPNNIKEYLTQYMYIVIIMPIVSSLASKEDRESVNELYTKIQNTELVKLIN